MPTRKCSACKKAPAMRLRDVCGICDCLDAGEAPGGHSSACWPYTSRFAGVCTDKELAEARRRDKAAGLHTEYGGKNGRDPIFRDPAHKRQYLRIHGLRNNNAGWND